MYTYCRTATVLSSLWFPVVFVTFINIYFVNRNIVPIQCANKTKTKTKTKKKSKKRSRIENYDWKRGSTNFREGKKKKNSGNEKYQGRTRVASSSPLSWERSCSPNEVHNTKSKKTKITCVLKFSVDLYIVSSCVQKFVSTTIRRSTLPYPELYTWQGCGKFVGDYIEYEPLDKALKMVSESKRGCFH